MFTQQSQVSPTRSLQVILAIESSRKQDITILTCVIDESAVSIAP